jgi:hypothetical protein
MMLVSLAFVAETFKCELAIACFNDLWKTSTLAFCTAVRPAGAGPPLYTPLGWQESIDAFNPAFVFLSRTYIAHGSIALPCALAVKVGD